MATGVQIAAELTQLGADLLAQRYRREQPELTEPEVEALVAQWWTSRPQAPHGDGVGRPGKWPR